MIFFKDHLFLFGGIQDITKEKNDIYVLKISSMTWNKIHTSTNSIYDCSPTLKQDKRKSPLKKEIVLHRISP
jgi:N-acetylneuraminic acid mutarotase